jgi:hypothetical protein
MKIAILVGGNGSFAAAGAFSSLLHGLGLVRTPVL